MNQCMTLHEPGQALVLVEREIPAPPPRGLILKVHCAGVCHTDVKLWMKRALWNPTAVQAVWGPPDNPHHRVVGHEMAGEVYTVGSEPIEGEEVLQIGDFVVTCAQQGCKDRCKHCNRGETIKCTKRLEHGLGFGYDGGFQKFVVIHDRSRLVKIPASVPMDTAAILACSALTSYNAVTSLQPYAERLMEYHDSITLLLIGAGGLGLWGIQFAKALLPRQCRIVVADLTEERLATAKQYGADDVIKWSGEDADIQRRSAAVCDEGVHLVLEYVSLPSTIKRATDLLTEGGCVALVGAHRLGVETSFDFSQCIGKRWTIMGVHAGSVPQLRQVVGMVAEGTVRPIPITHTKLEDLHQTLSGVDKGEYLGRAVVKMTD